MAIINMNTEQFNASVKDEEVILVEFMAPWCGFCRRIGPVFKKVAVEYEGKLPIGQINIDENAALADKEGIEAIPAFVMYKGGKAVASIISPDSKAKIEDFINSYI